MQSIRFSHQALVLIVSASTFGACSSSLSRPTPIPRAAGPLSPTHSAVPFGPGYAYVADDSNPGHVYVYQLPLSVHSQPLWAIEANGPGSTGFAGRQTFILVGGPSGEKREGVLVWRKKAGRVSFLLRTRLLPEMLEVDSHGDIFQG